MRIGWCCKWVPPEGDARPAAAMNLRDTTIAALSRLDGPARVAEKLLGLVRGNVAALAAQVEEAAAAPPLERCLRIVSNVLPCYTHPVARPRYGEPALREAAEGLAAVGARAREAGVRLSMHPGQFCVLSTESPTALANSVEEVEYHAHVMRLLGHAGGWHPHGAHVNVHGGARAPGVEGFRRGLALLSEDARGLLTVENDEIAYGLDGLLPLADALPIVLDLHHHWCHSAGERIAPDDPRIATVRASWRGARPIGHVSAPREDLMPEGMADPDRLPDWDALIAAGLNARVLRQHSDRMWNRPLNAWAASHLGWTDLEVEAKGKNLASHDLAKAARAMGWDDRPANVPVAPPAGVAPAA